jgi:hypothetical protein
MSIMIWSRYHKDTPILTFTYAAHLNKLSGTPEAAAFRRASRVNSSVLKRKQSW